MTSELGLVEKDGGVEIDVLVQPRASRTTVGGVHDGRLRLAVTAPPVDGEANAAVIEALAAAFGIGKRAVNIVRGATGRRKTVRLEGVGAAQVRAMATR